MCGLMYYVMRAYNIMFRVKLLARARERRIGGAGLNMNIFIAALISPSHSEQVAAEGAKRMSERETNAATVIQTRFRGYQARKAYTERLLLLFQEVLTHTQSRVSVTYKCALKYCSLYIQNRNVVQIKRSIILVYIMQV